jgi:hypothetical protein
MRWLMPIVLVVMLLGCGNAAMAQTNPPNYTNTRPPLSGTTPDTPQSTDRVLITRGNKDYYLPGDYFSTASSGNNLDLNLDNGGCLELGSGGCVVLNSSLITIGGLTSGIFNMTTNGLVIAVTTPPTTAPGAVNAQEFWVCGTNPGTIKKIVYGGTSTIPTILVDNVGGGAAGC